MVLKALTDQQENPESFSERVRQGALRGIVNAEPPYDC
jgi:PTS system ascorbate-specific IIA component